VARAEWLGEKPADHSDNEAREAAREELERDITIPYYTGIVEATVSQRMSIATEAIMSHLSNSIPMNHMYISTRLKAEQRSVGKHPPPEMQERVANKIRRLGDQIEMAQYIRGRIGMDRSTVLDMGRIPGYHTRRWPPSALSQGQENGQSEHAARACALERAPKRSRRQGPSTVIGRESFSPVTGSDQESPPYSPFSGDGQYSPVSEDEPDVQAKERPVEVKTEDQAEDLRLAQVAQKLTSRQSTT
jgi:hypothetical protein